MPTLYFLPTHDGVPASAVQEVAAAYLAEHDPKRAGNPRAVVDASPPLLDLDQVLTRLEPESRDDVRGHLEEQDSRLRPLAEELLPAPDGTDTPLTVGAIAQTWCGHPPGVLVGVREGRDVRVIGVFEEWRLDAAGHLSRTPTPAFEARIVVPASHKDTAVRAADFEQTFTDVTLTLTNYIGQYLSMTGLPAVGLLITLLSSQTQQAVDGSFSKGPGLIETFKKLLQANRISLENDLAGAVIQNYRDYTHTHYNDAWLEQVMNASDPLPVDITAKVSKLTDFIAKVTADFDTTSDLFTAVDLMRMTSPVAGDVHNATEAMLKAEGFFYMANVALTLGRQAFNAQYTMNGPKQAAKLADLLASYSQIYTDYATALKASVDQQVSTRVGLLRPGSAGGEVFIWDDYYDAPGHGQLAYSQKCCGSGDCDNKAAERNRILDDRRRSIATSYRHDLCARFWDGTASTFDQAVASMVDNNAKLQKLATDCKEHQ